MYDTNSLSYLDLVGMVGDGVLDAIGGLPATIDIDPYLDLVERIYTTMAAIHNNLIDMTEQVKDATTPAEASSILKSLDQQGIKDSLKADKMCDALQQMGIEMRSLPVNQLNLTDQEKAIWKELSSELEKREGGTAHLYYSKLNELDNLGQLCKTESDLKALQAKAAQTTDLLVIQKAQYERLANRAKRMRKLGR